jgi:hypothetical protein
MGSAKLERLAEAVGVCWWHPEGHSVNRGRLSKIAEIALRQTAGAAGRVLPRPHDLIWPGLTAVHGVEVAGAVQVDREDEFTLTLIAPAKLEPKLSVRRLRY